VLPVRKEIQLLRVSSMPASEETMPGHKLGNGQGHARTAIDDRPNDLTSIARVIDVGPVGAGAENFLHQRLVASE